MYFALDPAVVEDKALSRRHFLKVGVMAILASISPRLGFATMDEPPSPHKSLSFYETHTGESLETTYWAEGKYRSEALADINHILRDYRTGEAKAIDTRLLDLLFAIRLKVRTQQPFHVISGYRSPKTNALLRKCGRGVARNSLHMCGQAVDIRLPGCALTLLRRMAIDLKGGGVGYYPRPNFVHIDIGRVRYW